MKNPRLCRGVPVSFYQKFLQLFLFILAAVAIFPFQKNIVDRKLSCKTCNNSYYKGKSIEIDVQERLVEILLSEEFFSQHEELEGSEISALEQASAPGALEDHCPT